jgi:hypothetical protein
MLLTTSELLPSVRLFLVNIFEDYFYQRTFVSVSHCKLALGDNLNDI